jgi:hypothetical protein
LGKSSALDCQTKKLNLRNLYLITVMHKSSFDPTLSTLLESLSQTCQTKLLTCLKELAVDSVNSEDYKSLNVLAEVLNNIVEVSPTPSVPVEKDSIVKRGSVPHPLVTGAELKFGSRSELLEISDYIYNRVKADLDQDKFGLSDTTSYEYNDHIYSQYLSNMKEGDKARLLDLRVSPSRADRHLWKDAARAALQKLEQERLAVKSGRFTYKFTPKKKEADSQSNPPLSFPKFPTRPTVYKAGNE